MTAEVRFFEGAEAPSVSHQLTLSDLVVYAGASGDFFPVHYDPDAAKRSGMPGVFGHGMLTAGLLAKAVTDFVGVQHLRSFHVRFSRPTWPGETLHTRVLVVSVRRQSGEQLVELECAVVNDDGEAKVRGAATARLPLPG